MFRLAQHERNKPMQDFAVVARALVKSFGTVRAVGGIDLSVPTGSIYGVLGPNGAGKTTTLRMLLGIIDPDSGSRRMLGHERPLEVANLVGYLPEERGLYPSMSAREGIAFLAALRGLSLKEGRKRADELLEEMGLGAAARRPIRTLSKGMAQTVQLIGTIIHKPRLIVLDEPFSGLDALNQERLEAIIRRQAADGVTILFSTHVIAHAERLCERIAIIAGGCLRFEGEVDEARSRLPQQVRLRTRSASGNWQSALPKDAKNAGREWRFAIPPGGIEPLLKSLIDANAGIEDLAIERPGLHDAFVAIAGADAAAEMAAPARLDEAA